MLTRALQTSFCNALFLSAYRSMRRSHMPHLLFCCIVTHSERPSYHKANAIPLYTSSIIFTFAECLLSHLSQNKKSADPQICAFLLYLSFQNRRNIRLRLHIPVQSLNIQDGNRFFKMGNYLHLFQLCHRAIQRRTADIESAGKSRKAVCQPYQSLCLMTCQVQCSASVP